MGERRKPLTPNLDQNTGPQLVFAWRQKTGHSQQDLALKLGYKHNSSIHWYEHGRYPLKLEHLVALSRITGIPIWVLAWPEQRELIQKLVEDATMYAASA